MLDRLFALESFGIKLGLGNISRLCEALGHPERSFTAIHVAGTNGKGSVTAMVHAALVAGGIRAGRYVSPHLVDLAERFVIGTAQVSDADLERAAGDVLDCAERLRTAGDLAAHPTFFEATTALGFELFRRAGVQAAVIEVGLGGRFDSTNVVPARVGAITSVGFDHQDLLGDTIEAIAFEKAGIVKPGMTLVAGTLPDAARQVVGAVAADRQAEVVDASAGVRVDADVRDGRTVVTIDTPDDRYGPLTLGLRGEHQIGNALVAVRLLEAARRRTSLDVSREAIERGLTDVDWPGRLEQVEMPGDARVLLDAAHNVDGARALARYLQRWHPERPPLVIGMMRDKDVPGIVDALLPSVSTVVATAAATPRAIPARELAARIAACGATGVRAEPDPAAAVELALSIASSVCVTGSIFLIGAVRDRLRRRAILR
ncbi:MAG: bifunctional folylpolyglutamate synthase/dihydrofolate synthase [Acidobacteria bacterium]|nr:bifunctional folylpolyglutamate synthase/dihydrofolate synthase [Acidobacteriota bacterium]